MQRRSVQLVHGLVALLPLALVAACAGDPVEKLQRVRARHTATLQSFVIRDEPGAPRQIVLDVLVARDGPDVLPGITLDVSMAGPRGAEKEHRRVWVETGDLGPGGKQVAITLEDLPYSPGDGFFVEVRVPIPAEEQVDYREFGGAAAGTGGS